jgi:hypothetical protein
MRPNHCQQSEPERAYFQNRSRSVKCFRNNRTDHVWYLMPKSKTSPEGPDLNDQQQASMVQMGKLMGDPRDDFDREVEGHLQRMGEASAGKMRTAQMGLAPSPMEQAQVKQQSALGQQAATQGAVQAQQAQGAQIPIQPPSAPAGPAGATAPYPAQAGEVGPKETPESPATSGAPPAAPGGQEGP